MYASGTTATATATIGTGYIRTITLNDDGSGFTSTPTVAITTAPSGGTDAQAVAITTTRNSITSIKEILLINAGAGYTIAPTITISGGGGTGAAATCGIITDKKGVINIVVNNGGAGYSTAPNVTLTLPSLSPQIAASAKATVSAAGTISAINITDSGAGFFSTPSVTVAAAATTGIGTYWFNEVVTGSRSGATARVKNWDTDTNILRVGITTGSFYPGELVTGSRSAAAYEINVSAANTVTDKYRQNEEIELEADNIIDFTESNPFGTY